MEVYKAKSLWDDVFLAKSEFGSECFFWRKETRKPREKPSE